MRTMVTGTAEVGSATSVRFWQWKGIRHYLTTLWSGPPKADDLSKPVDHASWARSWARRGSFPAMFLFSFGSLMVLGGQQLTTYTGYAVNGRIDLLLQNIGGIIVLTTILVLILLMDLLMIVKCVDWIDKKSNGESYASERAFVWFVATVESITYTILLAALEHPAPLFVAGVFVFAALASWGLILLRAVAVPLVAVTSATIGDKVVTEKERITIQKHRTDNAIAESMNLVIATPSIDNIPLLTAYRRYLDTDVSTMTPAQRDDYDGKLFTHIQSMTPGALQQKMQQDLVAMQAQLASEKTQIEQQAQHDRKLLHQSHQSAIARVIADAEQSLADVTRKAEEQVNDLLTNFIPMMVGAVVDNAWPEQLVALTPVFAHIAPHTLIQQAGYAVVTTTLGVVGSSNLTPAQSPRNPMRPISNDDLVLTTGTPLTPISHLEPTQTQESNTEETSTEEKPKRNRKTTKGEQ